MVNHPNRNGVGKFQRRMLRHLDRWGELGPDAEDDIGLSGAALYSVLDAVQRRGLVEEAPGPISGVIRLTEAGRAALNSSEG